MHCPFCGDLDTKVIDSRLAVLDGMYHPKKVVHAEIKFWDLPPIDRESASANQVLSGRQRNILQAADALLLVVRPSTTLPYFILLVASIPVVTSRCCLRSWPWLTLRPWNELRRASATASKRLSRPNGLP